MLRFSSLDKMTWTDLWSFMPSDAQDVFDKISNSSEIRLIDLRERIYEGFITGNNAAFFMNDDIINQSTIEKELIHPVPKGKNVRRYSIKWDDEFIENLAEYLPL